MTMNVNFLNFLTAFFIFTAVGSAQCADDTTTVYANNYVIRETDSTVYGYAVTGPVTGNYGLLWQPYLSTWWTLNNVSRGSSQRESVPAGNGAAISRAYRAPLQTAGPGEYRLKSFHESYAAVCRQWAPPYRTGWDGYLNGYKTVVRPTLSGSNISYWLGGPTRSNDYSSQVTMSVANRNETTSTPVWSFTDPSYSTFGNLSCTTCSTSVFTATRGPTNCQAYNVVLKATFGGFDSEPYWIDIQTPNVLNFVRVDEGTPAGGGWESHVDYIIRDGCNIRMTNITANEVFTEWQRFNGANWTAPLNAYGWHDMYWDSWTNGWILVDILYELPGAGYSPRPMNNGTNGYSEAQSALMTQHKQVWRVGSSYNASPTGIPANVTGSPQGDNSQAQGVLVQTNFHYHYLDHGNHGRRN